MAVDDEVAGVVTTEDAGLGAPPPADEIALAVAQSRIATQLFGATASSATPVEVGRYRLLEEVGRGGMGVVWAAWDPELERRVAIKLLDPLKASARTRLLGEARALAKLSHPHVVPVYDVGVVDDRVYLVMEWIAGADLRRHLAGQRAVRVIVDVYVQAARGLEAVHAAGLVHRDFKPENALVGKDGRVRVVDFGLARGDVAGVREIAGTPRYMAPEQAAGEAVTPAIDQFALCVALREALVGRDGPERTAELPRHLARAIARGTEHDPAARFPSMRALIGALENDPARRRRRWVALGVAGVAIASAFALGARRDDTTCSGPPPGTLDTQARIEALRHVQTLGAFASGALPALTARLDAAEAAWRTEHRAACRAHANGALTTALYERRLTCLARVAATLDAASELLGNATQASFADAEVAAAATIPAAACARVDRSLLAPPPDGVEPAVRVATAAIERARLFATASHADAITRAVAARAAAEATGYAPAIARGLLVEGRARMSLDDPGAADVLVRAGRTALAAGDDATAVEAFARHAYVFATTTGRAAEGLDFVDALGARLDQQDFARLLWQNNRATVYLVMGNPAAARRLLEDALAHWHPGDGEDTAELVSIPHNLALVSERPADGLATIERARDELARRLGADHPHTLEMTMSSSVFVGDLAKARAIHDTACARLAELFPHLANEHATCAYEAAWLADEAADAATIARHAPVVAGGIANDPIRAAVVTAIAGEATPAAAAKLETIAHDAEADESRWTRLAAADAYVAGARLHTRRGAATDATRDWAAALALLESDPRVFSARRLARVRGELARNVAASDPERARPLAAAAVAWYRAAGAPEASFAALTALAR